MGGEGFRAQPRSHLALLPWVEGGEGRAPRALRAEAGRAVHLRTLRGCDRWPRPAAALGWEMRGCGCGFELGLCVPCRAGKVGSGSGQLWAAAPRSRRELRVEGASHGRSGAGQVWVARPRRWGGSFRWVWSQREGEKSEGRAALCRGGGQLPPAPTCWEGWEGWGSVTTASLHFHARSEKGVDSVSFPSLV